MKNIIKNTILVMKKSPKYACLIIILELFMALILPFNLSILSKIIDAAGQGELIYQHLTLFTSISILEVFFSYFKRRFSLNLELELNQKISLDIMNKASKTKFQHFEDANALDTIKLAESAADGKLYDLYIDSISFLGNIIKLLGFIWIFHTTSLFLSLLYILMIILMCYFDYRAINMMNTMFNSESRNERLLDYYDKSLNNRDTLYYLTVVNGFKIIRKKIKNLANAIAKERIDTTMKSSKFSFAARFTILIWFSLSFYILTTNVLNDKINIGMFAISISALSSAIAISESVSVGLSNVSQNSFFVDKYNQVMNFDDLPTNTNKIKFDDTAPFIEFRNVSFKYPNSKEWVLRDLSFKLDAHEKVALVGENGCGKSTIIKLILGLYEPIEGQILIMGIDSSLLNYDMINNLFAAVFQDHAKFDLSVGENLSLSNHLEHELAIDALKFSNSKLSSNLDAILGKLNDDKTDLSGGEWQRLAMSRAIYKHSKFKLFDEPVSQLDPLAEAELYSNIMGFIKDGAILVSHRLGSAKLAERILVIRDGSVFEDGDHNTLLNNNSYYCEMYKSQSQWYKE